MHSDEFKFACPHCQFSLTAPPEMVGHPIECPQCNKWSTTPSAEPKHTDHVSSLAIHPPVHPAPAPPTVLPGQTPGIVLTYRSIVIIGMVLLALIAGLAFAVVVLLHERSLKPQSEPARTIIVTTAPTVPFPAQPQPISQAPISTQTLIIVTQPQPVLGLDWERQNRSALIRMLTDGHVYAADNQSAKTLATYGLLFDLIGTNAIQDGSLQSLIDQAKAERDRLAQAQQDKDSQATMVLQGTVSLARDNGDHVSPPTDIFLAKANSSAAAIMAALMAQVRNFDNANAAAQADSDAGDVQAFLPAELRSKHAAQQVIYCNIAIRKEALRDNDCVSSRTDALGNFVFTQVAPGRYYLAAMSSIADQRMLWVLRVDKGDGPLTLTLDNDNALVVAIDVWSWDW